VTETIDSVVISDREVSEILGLDVSQVPKLKEEWITRFVENGGTKLVLGILKDMNEIA
jgi:hypothetical protein